MTSPISRAPVSTLQTDEGRTGGADATPEAAQLRDEEVKQRAAPGADQTSRWQTTTRINDNPGILGRAQSGFANIIIEELAKEHRAGIDVSYGPCSGSAFLSEEVALAGSDVYRNLVGADRRREAYAVTHADSHWVKTRAYLGTSVALPLGGATFGFNGSMEVSSIAAQQHAPLGDMAVEQARSMLLPLRADGFKEMNAAPGTEWAFRGQAGYSIGNAQSDADLTKMSTSVGVAASIGRQNIYTKNVKLLEDNKVFFVVGRHDIPQAGIAVGGNIKLMEVKSTSHSGEMAQKQVSITAAAGASVSWPHRQLAGTVLDLNKPTDQVHYEYLMHAMPVDAEEYIKKNGLGGNYVGDGRAISTGFALKFGSTKLLSTSTLRSKEKGVLVKDGVATQLGEATYNRIVEGVLPRFALGEERNVSVRAGEVTRADGQSEAAIAVRLSVSDPSVSAEELRELVRFAEAMGAPTKGLPDPNAAQSFGRGNNSVEVAITDSQLAKLGTWEPNDIRLAFASAQREIEGSAGLPPWYSDRDTLEQFRSQLRMANTGPRRDNTLAVKNDYARKYPGRELSRDLASLDAINLVLEQAKKCRGKPVEDWGPVLEAVGMQASNDVRAGLLALHRLSGAEAVQLSSNVGGVTSNSVGGAVPKNLLDLVGSVMLPD